MLSRFVVLLASAAISMAQLDLANPAACPQCINMAAQFGQPDHTHVFMVNLSDKLPFGNNEMSYERTLMGYKEVTEEDRREGARYTSGYVLRKCPDTASCDYVGGTPEAAVGITHRDDLSERLGADVAVMVVPGLGAGAFYRDNSEHDWVGLGTMAPHRIHIHRAQVQIPPELQAKIDAQKREQELANQAGVQQVGEVL